MSQTPVEHVMVVPTLLFHELGYFQGFSSQAERYLKTLLDPAFTSYRPRHEVEEDPSFKQLIPYCIFRHEDRVFHYKRGKKGEEGRLHSKQSIGIGGHVSSEDGRETGTPYFEAMQREIEEEVYLESRYRQQCVGLINDDQTEVGKVHLGVVHLFELDEAKVRPRERSIRESGFAFPAELAEVHHRFESWSQICLDHLF